MVCYSLASEARVAAPSDAYRLVDSLGDEVRGLAAGDGKAEDPAGAGVLRTPSLGGSSRA
jgi:hypothetical protein